MFNLKIDDRELGTLIRNLEKLTTAQVFGIISKGARVGLVKARVRQQVIAAAPKRTGKLKSQISRVRQRKRSRGKAPGASFDIGDTARVAIAANVYEYGRKAGKSRQPARPYIRPILEREDNQIRRTMAEDIAQSVDKRLAQNLKRKSR